MLNINIGIIGKLGSGKTSAANLLINEYGYKRLSLADPIKAIMKEYLDIKDKTDSRYRKVAQMIGTEWFRSVDDLVWVKYLLKRASRLKKQVIVCDDVRFVNEAETFLSNGWVLLYLDAPLEIRRQRCIARDGVFDDATINHPSETGVDDIVEKFGADFSLVRIDASGSMDEMFEEIEWALNKFDVHKQSEVVKWFKRGEWKNWQLKIGMNGLRFTKKL